MDIKIDGSLRHTLSCLSCTHTHWAASVISVSSFYRLCESGGTLGFISFKQACTDPTVTTYSSPQTKTQSTLDTVISWKMRNKNQNRTNQKKKEESEKGFFSTNINSRSTKLDSRFGCGSEQEHIQTIAILCSERETERNGMKERIRKEAKLSVSSSLPERCFASPGPCALCSVLSNKTPGLMLENSLQAVNHLL